MRKLIFLMLLASNSAIAQPPNSRAFSEGNTSLTPASTTFTSKTTTLNRIIEYVHLEVDFKGTPNSVPVRVTIDDGLKTTFVYYLLLSVKDPVEPDRHAYELSERVFWVLPPNKSITIKIIHEDAEIKAYVSGYEYKSL